MALSALETLTAEITGLSRPIGEKAMLDWQLSKIRGAMRRAAERNSRYAERFRDVDIDSIRTLDDYAVVPFTYPEELTDNAVSFVCEPERNISRITSLRTSGSTGAPKRVYFTDNDLNRTIRLFELGMRPVIGGDGSRCLIMMSDSTPGSLASLLKEGVERSGFPAEIYGTIRDFSDAAKSVRNGDAIVGIPWQMLSLCREHPELRPASVLLSADYVPSPVPDAIRSAWKCRVYTHYGLTETCFGCAVQCGEHSAHHIRHDCLLIEIINPESGRRLDFGEEGEIVITAFLNEAMPLFRYRTGDISSLENGLCECGSVLPRLRAVKGRLKNRITIDGKTFSIETMDDVLYALPELWQYEASFKCRLDKNALKITAVGPKSLNIAEIYAVVSSVLPKDIEIIVEKGKNFEEIKKRRIECIWHGEE